MLSTKLHPLPANPVCRINLRENTVTNLYANQQRSKTLYNSGKDVSLIRAGDFSSLVGKHMVCVGSKTVRIAGKSTCSTVQFHEVGHSSLALFSTSLFLSSSSEDSDEFTRRTSRLGPKAGFHSTESFALFA